MAVTRTAEDIPLVVLSDGYWTDRGAFLAEAYAHYGPVFRARHLKTEVVFLIGPEANRFLLATQRLACSHTGGWNSVFGGAGEIPNLLTMDPPDHELHRRILAPAFSATRMNSYMPLINRVIERRLTRWSGRAEIDAYEEARIIAFDLAVRAFLGLQPGPEVELGRAVYLFGAGGRAGAYTALLRRLIAVRRTQPHQDALGLLAQASDDRGQPLSDDQLLAHAEILLVAGYETTASLAAWAIYLLAAHPHYAQLLQVEIDPIAAEGPLTLESLLSLPMLDRLLLEAERLYPPVPNAPRRLLTDLEFHGHLLPAGTLVFYSPAGTHRLEDLWSAPQCFDPDRFAPPRSEHRRTSYALIGFGGGPRMCIGQTFARVQLRVLLAQTVQRYALSVVSGQSLVQRYGVTTRPLHGIRLSLTVR